MEIILLCIILILLDVSIYFAYKIFSLKNKLSAHGEYATKKTDIVRAAIKELSIRSSSISEQSNTKLVLTQGVNSLVSLKDNAEN